MNSVSGWGQGRSEAGRTLRKPWRETSQKKLKTDLEQVSLLDFQLQVLMSERLRKIQEYLVHGFTDVL